VKLTIISTDKEIICFGMRSIAAYLELNGIDTQLIFLADPEFQKNENSDEKYRYSDALLDDIVKLCQSSDIIGFSIFSCDLESSIQITDRLKRDLDIPIIWGGKHPSALPEMAIKYADIVAIGESEIPMVELLQKMEKREDYHNVKGFWFKQNGRIIKNPVGALIENLDDIPILEYVSDSHYVWDKKEDILLPVDESVLERYRKNNPYSAGKVYHVMTSRGCPFSCSYCYTFKHLYMGQKYVRRRSVENVIEELVKIKERHNYIDVFSFADDEFMSASAEYIRKLCELYKQKISIPFGCLFYPSTVTDEKLKDLIDAGLLVVQMGIQTGSEQTLKLYLRKVTNERTLQAVKLINKYKDSIMASYDFIIDNPYEQRQDLVNTIKFIMQFPEPYTLNIFSLTFFPGTKLFEKAVEDKLIDTSKMELYTKKYEHYNRRYLNLILLLLKYHMPRHLIRFLISRPMVFVFDRQDFTFIFSHIVKFWKTIKRLLGMKKPAGGFNFNKKFKDIKR
jgi:anaerobic magnesium-protoporphyrin IX monomethyl ester cyclase